MKHQIPDDIIATSDLIALIDDSAKLSRWERLDLWADALERHHGQLSALRRLEYLSPDELRNYRGANTPLTIAFDDPALRSAGLSGDSLGEAMDFFELTDRDAHRLLCDCHYHGAMTGSGVARRIRRHARSGMRRAKWIGAFRRILGRAT